MGAKVRLTDKAVEKLAAPVGVERVEVSDALMPGLELRITMNASRAHNLYWTHNRLRGPMDRKPSEEDVAEALFTHVDIDPRPPGKDATDDNKARWNEAERERIMAELRAFQPKPTIVVDSGGGFQSFWRLDTSFFVGGADARITDMKAYNMGLRDAFKTADSCQSLDHLMRLPFTVNWPDAKKRKKGRKPRLATVVWNDGPVHPLHSFTPASVEPMRASSAPSAPRGDVRRLAHPDELGEWGIGEADRLRVLIVQGCDPDKFDGNRSDVVFDLCCNLTRRGAPRGLIAGIISDPDWPISAHVIDKGGRDTIGYAWRQVEQAERKIAAEGEPFQTDKDGKPYANQHNLRLALSKLNVTVRYDSFADRAALTGLEGFGPYLNDAAMTRLWLRVDEEHRLKFPKEYFWSVVEDAARRDAFHPVVDYLGSLTWDGKPRLDGWMSTYLAAKDDDYTRAVGALMLVAAVRRVRHPGCKFDEMVVLESEQGKAKSSALAVLAVREDWFHDDLPLNAKAQLVIEQTQGRWIIEAGELKGMKAKDIEHLKNFLSRRRDSSRMAYGRLPQDVPRHFIVVGTTNDDRYLIDSTGNRRFWPVRVGDIDLEALARDRDQLWAEAAAREAAGASIRLDRSLWQAAALEQDERRTVDPFVAPLADLFRDLQGKVASRDVWRFLGTPIDRRTPEQERRLGAAMRELGFEHTKARFGGGPEGCYRRGDEEARKRRIVVVWSPDDTSHEGESSRWPREEGKGPGEWFANLEGEAPSGRLPDLDLDEDERAARNGGRRPEVPDDPY